MKTISLIAAIAAALLVVPAQGQPNAVATKVTPYYAIGPVPGSSGYNNFLSAMAQAMWQDATAIPQSSGSVHFLANGAKLPATNLFSYPDNSGSCLLAGAVFQSSALFTLNQAGPVLFTSPYWSFTNTFSGMSYSSHCIGIKWGPGGPGTADIVYTSGNADTIQVNMVVVIENELNFVIYSDETTGQGISVFFSSFGLELPVTSTYSLNSAGATDTAVFYTPDPVLSLNRVGGTNAVIKATNGIPDRTCFLLGSTNSSLPLSSWKRLSTNALDSAGNMTVTNRMNPAVPCQFYTLQLQRF